MAGKKQIDYSESLRKIKEENNNPQPEYEKVKLIQNKFKIKNKDVTQFKVTIPKKFADYIELNKEEFSVKAILEKKPDKIIIEITKNE